MNVSSISVSHGGSASTLDYTLSKAALESLTYSLSNSYSKHNILVNAIRAGVTDTKIHKLNPNKDLKERKKKIPLGRIAFPKEIAAVVDFLCSNQSSFVTGAVIPVSGGE